jgi:soluble lytic murein transglycosylase-like protein
MRKQRNKSNYRFLLTICAILFLLLFSYSTCSKAGVVELIEEEAKKQHFDPNIAVAVASVESSLNQNVVGKAGEIGVFQVLPRTVPLGTNLFDLKTNIHWGIVHLKYWQRRCPTIEGISFVNCYNSGFRHPRYPFLRPYVRKVAAIMRKQ